MSLRPSGARAREQLDEDQRRQRIATTVVFIANGATFASWLPRLPEIQARAGISLTTLGIALTGVGLGGLIGGPVANALIGRVGSRSATVAASGLLAILLPVVAVPASALSLALVLLGVGVVDAIADISMNIQASHAQARTARSVIHRFHAAWSLGGVLGGLAGSGAAAAEIPLASQLGVTGLLLVAAVVAARTWLSPVDDIASPPADDGRSKRSVLLWLAAAAFAVAVVEGVPGAWAAIFGTDVHGASPGAAGLAFAAVTIGMLLGRTAGDVLTDRHGDVALFRLAAAVSALGGMVVAVSPTQLVAIAGFGLCGLGVSVLFPSLYRSAGSRAGISSRLGLAVMSSGGRIGFLVAPVLLGPIADVVGLRVAYGSVLVAASAAAVVAVSASR